MRFCILISFLFIFTAGSYAQVTSQATGAPYLSLGAYSNQVNDVFGTRGNVASLARLLQAGVGTYGERRFMLDNLNLYSFAAAVPVTNGGFGLYGSYLGFAQSNQSQLSLAYGRKVTGTIDVGATFHYHSIRQAGIYGNASAITGSVSMLLHLTDKITAGVNIFNPVRAGYNKAEDERLPARLSFGVGYDASEKLFMTTEIEKEENQPVNVNAALHYQFIPQFFIRGGIATQTAGYFAGFGMQLKDFRIDVASSFHPQLGLSPGVLLLMNVGKKKTEVANTTE